MNNIPLRLNNEYVEERIRKYRNESGLKRVNILYCIVRAPMNCPMCVSVYPPPDDGEPAFLLEISPNFLHDIDFDLTLCHELGHIHKILHFLANGKQISAPKTVWDHIKSEVSADQFAVDILLKMGIKRRQIRQWLWKKVRSNVKNLKRAEYKDFIRRDLAVNFARFIANLA